MDYFNYAKTLVTDQASEIKNKNAKPDILELCTSFLKEFGKSTNRIINATDHTALQAEVLDLTYQTEQFVDDLRKGIK